ncbi:MAG: TadA family conjugal transfer-associated ATPase [Mycetocola sp.]
MTDRFVATPKLGLLGAAVPPAPTRPADGRTTNDALQRHGREPPPFGGALSPGGTRAGPPGQTLADARLTRMRMAAEFGPLAPYLMAADVTDVFVNGEGGLWIDRGAGLERDAEWSMAERPLRELAVRLIALGGRHIDEATPCVDVRLHGGVRVHAILPPVSVGGTVLSIRIPQVRRFGLADLAAADMFGDDSANLLLRLRAAVAERVNLLVTGAGGSGKTTLLGALLAEAPHDERIVAIEDVAELGVEHPHFVSLESRQANLEGAGAIGLERLVREALRMRPDRLVVGECRGGEVRELLAALNTGHAGGAGTLHANSLPDVPARVEALGALAGMTPDAVARQTVSAIGLVLHLERHGGVRRLDRVGRFELDGDGRLAVRSEAGAQ